MDFVKFMDNQFDKLRALFHEKHKQYGTDDPLANFRTGARLRLGEDDYAAMYDEAAAYMCKHVAHVYNNGIRGRKAAESLSDIANYCLIMKYMIEENEAAIYRANLAEQKVPRADELRADS